MLRLTQRTSSRALGSARAGWAGPGDKRTPTTQDPVSRSYRRWLTGAGALVTGLGR